MLRTRGKITSNRRRSNPATDLQRLHDILIEPIHDLLPNNPEDRVIFLPHEALFLVPFAALQDSEGQYLLNTHTIITAPSFQILGHVHQRYLEIEQSSLENSLILANPEPMPTIVREFGDPPKQLDDLPNAEVEADVIGKLLNTDPLIGRAATKEALLSRLPNSRIVHLATHGLLDDFDPSNTTGTPGAIALAALNGENGLLTSDEISNMQLNSELVILSACDTGRGEITGDGVVGLSRSLIAAGVPSTVVSLWLVPDDSTSFLMTEFYRYWHKEDNDKAQALRQAMLNTMLKYPKPRDWAAFTLIGEAD